MFIGFGLPGFGCIAGASGLNSENLRTDVVFGFQTLIFRLSDSDPYITPNPNP